MKKCTKCGNKYSDTAYLCPSCSIPLVNVGGEEEMSRLDFSSLNDNPANKDRNNETNYSYPYSRNTTYYAETWMYVAAVLCPLWGIVFSCISYAKGEDEICKKVLAASLISLYVCMIIWFFVSKNQNDEMMRLINRMY